MTSPAQITELLELKNAPVAISFRSESPSDLPKIEKTALSGCTYWKHASSGKRFYTSIADHLGCPIGAYTHGIDEPEDHSGELGEMVGMMIGLEYIKEEEIPGIPRYKDPFEAVVYSPLDQANGDFDVLLITGQANQIMVLAEAAHAAGIASNQSMIGRPTCAAIPAVLESGGFATNLGCIGNRVYTERTEGEVYFIVSASQLGELAKSLAAISNANQEIEKFHRGRVANEMV